MKEALSVKRPGLADEFVVELMSNMEHDARTNLYTITAEKLNDVIQTVAISVMRTQRESYENSIYKREKLYPLLRSLAIQYRQPDMYALGPLDATDIFVMPKGIPEMVVRQRQVSITNQNSKH
ncbi:hypothetical protein AHF37_06025 [Paragonimus kellicotti]|nr:hypothetical protein AHF37_06025 [Paragonimus kellicotti]